MKNDRVLIPERGRRERARLWEQKVRYVGTLTDEKGKKMDKGVVETVVAFNLNGLSTSSSCEGHENKYIFPYVSLALPRQPQETFVDEKKIISQIAQQYHIPVEEYWEALVGKDTKRLSTLVAQFGNLYHKTIIKEARPIFQNNEKTDERRQWEKGVRAITKKVRTLLDEFYKNREFDPEIGLTILSLSSQVMSAITYDDPDVQLLSLDQEWESKYTEEVKRALQEKIVRSRLELQAFGLFLKKRFFDRK